MGYSLWANLHPSFPLGFALAVYLEWHASREGSWYTTPLLFCLLLLSAGYLQPQGWPGLFYPFKAMQFPTGDWKPWFEQAAESHTRQFEHVENGSVLPSSISLWPFPNRSISFPRPQSLQTDILFPVSQWSRNTPPAENNRILSGELTNAGYFQVCTPSHTLRNTVD